MADSQNTTTQEIPQGFCQCGCGQQTNLAKKTSTRGGAEKGKPLKFIPWHHLRGKSGELCGNWKGGKTKTNGYILVLKPDHPMANCMGYVLEHILVMEKSLGRYLLLGEVVHHIDEDRANNVIGNLMLFRTRSMHTAFHHRLKAFKETGHWDWIKCPYCHQYDDPKNMVFSRPRSHHHQKCQSQDNRKRYASSKTDSPRQGQ